jgi:hypothetical protein
MLFIEEKKSSRRCNDGVLMETTLVILVLWCHTRSRVCVSGARRWSRRTYAGLRGCVARWLMQMLCKVAHTPAWRWARGDSDTHSMAVVMPALGDDRSTQIEDVARPPARGLMLLLIGPRRCSASLYMCVLLWPTSGGGARSGRRWCDALRIRDLLSALFVQDGRRPLSTHRRRIRIYLTNWSNL